MDPVIRILLVDDHPLVREGLRGAISSNADMAVVASVGSGKEALAVCERQTVDIVLLDLRMPDMDGMQTLMALKQLKPSPCVIMLTSDDRELSVRKALAAGASGFLSKSVRAWDLTESLRKAAQDGSLPLEPGLAERVVQDEAFPQLTAREQDVLVQMSQGVGNEDIATALGVSLNTVKTHVNAVLTKLGASSRTEAVVIAIRAGRVDID